MIFIRPREAGEGRSSDKAINYAVTVMLRDGVIVMLRANEGRNEGRREAAEPSADYGLNLISPLKNLEPTAAGDGHARNQSSLTPASHER
jgi:hypothetical protein